MNEKQMEAWLSEAIIELANEETKVVRVSTYDDVGMLTMNKGLVVRFKDGDEFQICIVQSEGGNEEDEELKE